MQKGWVARCDASPLFKTISLNDYGITTFLPSFT